MDFLGDVNRNLRSVATAWLAVATICDAAEIDKDAREAIDDGLAALAAGVKLIAVSVADAVAAVHASKGRSAEFAAIHNGLKGAAEPDFVTEHRFAVLSKAAARAEMVETVHNKALGGTRPNFSKKRKFAWRRRSSSASLRKVPRQVKDDSTTNQADPEMEQPSERVEQRSTNHKARQRPFRSYVRPRGKS